MSNPTGKRDVFILAVCQALYMTGTSLMISTGPLVGYMLADHESLATLPLATHHLGVMLATMPASLLMGRIGRRAGFMLGACIGACGAALAGWAIVYGSFWLLCLGVMIVGFFNGFAVFYRFAAADAATPEFRPKAISWVLTGGLFAAFFGPELAKQTKDLLAPIVYAGAYFSLIGVYLLSLVMLSFVRIPRPTREERQAKGRPLLEILLQPRCAFAVMTAVVAYGVMSLLMTATPLAMVECGFGFNDSATVIQLHILGMFAPSFITGWLIQRFGTLNVIMAGIALNIVCVAINLAGIEFVNFSTALLLLGVGWNFMFIGATNLLTQTHEPSERGKVQGFNDFAIFATVALSAFSSGNLLYWFDWETVNFGVVPFLALVLLAAVWVRLRGATSA